MVESAQSIADIDPYGIVLLGQESPDILLRWIYQNLGLDDSGELDRDWVSALHRGAMDSTESVVSKEFSYALQLQRYPVDIDKFLFGDHYLQKNRDTIYDQVLLELKQINNPGGQRIVNPYSELLATGGIGSAKSTTALYTVAYQLYVLSCFADPHGAFGLDPSSEILFVFQSLSGTTAKEVDYDRFYAMLEKSPYFNIEFPYNKRMTSKMEFPYNIRVQPIGTDGGTIGQNVMGGLIDELNFMALVENSKKSIDGGVYNQALTIYNSIARRRKSRFLKGGSAPGILCLVSSKRYPGEFTDIKLAEAKTDKTIYVYDYRVWEVKPAGSFSSQRFRVFIGDATRKAEIVTSARPWPAEDAHLLVEVPMDFLKEFQDDMQGSLRDIAGVSTLSRYPYIYNVTAVGACFGKHRSILNLEETDMESTQLQFYPERFRNLNHRRWAHIDLGHTSDAAGITVGHVSGFHEPVRGAGHMPIIDIDFILRVKPPRQGEINFAKIRNLLVLLRQHGLPITWVTFDSYQSTDSIQILRGMSFITGLTSMDRDNRAYDFTKTAFYEGRVRAPYHAHCLKEFASLEKDPKTGKIDHPTKGSKDCSDALSGVVYGLTTRREIWVEHGVPINTMIEQTREAQVQSERPPDRVVMPVDQYRPEPPVPPQDWKNPRPLHRGTPRS